MSSRKDQAVKLAKRLNSEIAKPRTWRDVARDYPAIVKAGTLNRIAKTNGAWLPKRKEILDALGLVAHPEPLPEWLKEIKKHISKLAKNTRQEMSTHGILKGK